MNQPMSDECPTCSYVFRDVHWKTRWIAVGIVFLMLVRSTALINREWLYQFPWWLVVLTMLWLPEVFMLIYPFLTRDKAEGVTQRFCLPARWIREVGIAIPVVVGVLVLNVLMVYLFRFTGVSEDLTPDGYRNMQKSHDYVWVGAFFVTGFTIVPIAEEVFFRGFLYNAFRARMPLIAALLLQSLVFGFFHPYTAIQNSAVVVTGLALALTYEWRKTLLAPILVHCGVNFVYALAMGGMMVLHATSPVMGVELAHDADACTIQAVTPGFGADLAGIEAGDVITAFNGRTIEDARDLLEEVRFCKAGDMVPVTYMRDGTERVVMVVLRERREDNS